MGGRNPPKNSWIASVELLQGIIRRGGGGGGGRGGTISMAKHMESWCTTEGGFLLLVCCIKENFDNR
jgi:hypothetical protein